MELKYKDITIRNAVKEDAEQLMIWWNDGKVMAHAGFPNGLGTTCEKIISQIEKDRDDLKRRHIIMYKNKPIGEMSYENKGNSVCEMGIKICDADMQNKGLGKVILSLFISGLFSELGFTKIILDTNLQNKRAQHVYEELGFKKVRINIDSWRDQLGQMQSSVDYELEQKCFHSFIE